MTAAGAGLPLPDNLPPVWADDSNGAGLLPVGSQKGPLRFRCLTTEVPEKSDEGGRAPEGFGRRPPPSIFLFRSRGRVARRLLVKQEDDGSSPSGSVAAALAAAPIFGAWAKRLSRLIWDQVIMGVRVPPLRLALSWT